MNQNKSSEQQKPTSYEALSAAAPSIEDQVTQLKAAGWFHVRAHVWKSPDGGWFPGPHGAWLVMKGRALDASKEQPNV